MLKKIITEVQIHVFALL